MSRRTLAGLALLLLSCGATTRNNGSPGVDSSAGGAGGVDGAAGASGAPLEPQLCAPAPAGLVRLTIDEAVESARVLLGDGLGQAMQAHLGERPELAFPPLASPQEGAAFTEAVWSTSDDIAQFAGSWVREHFDVTACERGDFDCVRDYVASLGERAFRRPLDSEERSALLQPVELAEALAVDTSVAAEYGVYAVFDSPHFLYRRELGQPASGLLNGERRLNDYELASSLAFFLTGSPPDEDLLAAAATGALSDDAEIEKQVERLLDAPRTKTYLERLMRARLRLSDVQSVVVDSPDLPLTAELRLAMQSELEALLTTTLWSGGVGGLFTSRQARVNADLANLYGIDFPPPGGQPDADGFVDTLLPESRAGLFTRAGWAALTSRPERTSVVLRGLKVMSLLCEPAPPLPDLDPNVRFPPNLSSASVQELAAFRMTTPGCRECHMNFDAFGLSLENLDQVGRFRTSYQDGRPVDASATLPAFAGGAAVNGAVELSKALSESQLAGCLSQNFLSYAQNTRQEMSACDRTALEAQLAQTGDPSFRNALKQITLSRTFRLRKG